MVIKTTCLLPLRLQVRFSVGASLLKVINGFSLDTTVVSIGVQGGRAGGGSPPPQFSQKY